MEKSNFEKVLYGIIVLIAFAFLCSGIKGIYPHLAITVHGLLPSYIKYLQETAYPTTLTCESITILFILTDVAGKVAHFITTFILIRSYNYRRWKSVFVCGGIQLFFYIQTLAVTMLLAPQDVSCQYKWIVSIVVIFGYACYCRKRSSQL